ncbi:nucleoside-diphosphate sugar epimerase/dehydratase [Geobacter sp. SVR]|uniref:polysaccharide biosynthesis protein n=1 Tax=Geobacter sp. SVR TaxID=2495594 RepID=UPI00143EFB73|nr:nucleoside-diphosphate sugar epimerase/dehydratase [Geobacter sp. SVR]BCS51987.1 nucleoside-diphosphate sugar epimerase [Geobacter sp. SVR]GCF87198.1 nucleoside-diphosphate sugar epimerase [Geobacter sp. SVR]
MLTPRRIKVFLCDLVLISLALCLAFLLRFDFRLAPAELELLKDCLLVVLVVKPLVFITVGFYQSLWRYASLQDGIEIFKGISFSTILAVTALLFLRQFTPLPRSIFVLDWFLLFALVAASRLVWRIYRESCITGKPCGGQRTLIIGAGEAGSLLLKEIRRQPHTSYNVIGFVDDDPEKRGMKLHGVPVLGVSRQLRALIMAHEIEEVIIAMPSANGKIIKPIIDSCKNANVTFKTLPSINELINGKLTVSQIKNVEIQDLLGRAPVVLDRELIGDYLTGKRVVVTGAAGSIGSEICRQVADFQPDKLILLEQAETPLYEIEKELTLRFPGLRVVPLVADVRDREKIFEAFEEYAPEVVFHAAAYKHVPMMEYNPTQAVLNNVFGSRNIADAAHYFRIRNLVMISTDKAVNPTNIMGASKRAAEIYIQALSRTSSTKFTTVRFGNVLGSNGSVIPLFKEQIAKGGPVTVTDRRIIRYFMTIPEATQLVLQAGSMGRGGEILVLDMGEPVRIVDLAEELIRLSGLTPYEDIDIVFTGLRPGEKLFEELLIDGEGILPTTHGKIRVLTPVQVEMGPVKAELELLYDASRKNRVHELMASLKRLVPEFKPAYSFTGEAPLIFQRVRPDLFPPLLAEKAKILPLKK